MTVGDAEMQCQGCGADVRLWVRRDGQEWGPFDLATVRHGRAEGRIVDTDEVRVGDGAWAQVGTLSYTPTAELGRPVVGATPSRPTVRAAVAAVVSTLVACAVVGGWSYYSWTTSQAELHCRQNLTSLGLAMKAYAMTHGGAQPTMGAGLPEALKPYLPATTEWWTCPATRKPYLVSAKAGPTGRQPVAWDAATARGTGPHRGKWHVLEAAGKVEDATAQPQGGVAVTGLESPATGKKP